MKTWNIKVARPWLVVTASACAMFAVVTAHAQRSTAAVDWRMPFESKTVKGIPYAADLVSESIQTLADGNRIVQRTTGRVYRDNEGRVRREENQASGGSTISITDVAARTSISLNSDRREATESAMPLVFSFAGDQFFVTATNGPQRAERVEVRKREVTQSTEGRGGRGVPAPDLAKQLERLREEVEFTHGLVAGRGEQQEEKLTDRLIGGVIASGTRRTTTIPAGAIGNEQPIRIVSEEWFSPELQILVMSEHTDPRTGRSTYELSNINRNEPDPSLFQIPADYTVHKFGAR